MNSSAETSQPEQETLDYIASADLADEVVVRSLDADEPMFGLEEATRQGAVVDSNLATWPEGTPLAVKNAVAAWMLFAQRAASAKVPDKDDTVGWFDAYLDTLQKTGWVLRGQRAAWQQENVHGFVMHEKILQFITVALGPVPGALALVTAALTSLQQINKDSKWITLFDRRGREAKAVGFSLTSCEASSDGSAAMNAADFRVHAEQTMTQVLFFKFNSREAKMFYRGTVLDLSQHVLSTYGPAIQARVDALIADNIAVIDLGDV